MKQLPAFLVLALAGTACQPQAASTDTAAAKAEAPAIMPVNYRTKAAAPLPNSSLSPVHLALLRKHDIGPLLQSVTANGDTAIQVQNGFFGPAGYRIEMALTKMQRDARQPGVFQVQGKSRYKKVITPFSGTIVITQLLDQPKYSPQEVAEGSQNQPNMYTAVGNFELREDARQRGAGVFRGKVALDFVIDDDNSVRQMMQTMHTLTQGGGVKYAGTWTNNATGKVQPVVWVENIFAYQGPQVFRDFTVGERDVDFNPKYAKLGWNTYWQNDEWWIDAGKPALHAETKHRIGFSEEELEALNAPATTN